MEERNRNDNSFGDTARANAAGLELESLLGDGERGEEAVGREAEGSLADEEQVDRDASLRRLNPHAFFPVYKTIHL